MGSFFNPDALLSLFGLVERERYYPDGSAGHVGGQLHHPLWHFFCKNHYFVIRD